MDERKAPPPTRTVVMNDGARLTQVQCDTIKQTEEELKTDLLPQHNESTVDTTLNSHIQVTWSFLWSYLIRKLTLRDLYKSSELVKCDITFNIANNKVYYIGGHGVVHFSQSEEIKKTQTLTCSYAAELILLQETDTKQKSEFLMFGSVYPGAFFWRLG